MKKIIIALLLIVMTAVLSGCGMRMQADDEAAGGFRYLREPLGYILVDQHTGVMYWMTFDEYHGTYSPITMLVNPDGTPKVWDGEIQ